MSPYERLECLEDIRAQVQGAWRTDEIRRQKPTPQAEMRQGLSYFHATIAPSLPLFYRRIDTALAQIGQPRLPLDRSLFRFGSWMGGDRDGNPFVTADTTRDVVIAVREDLFLLRKRSEAGRRRKKKKKTSSPPSSSERQRAKKFSFSADFEEAK